MSRFVRLNMLALATLTFCIAPLSLASGDALVVTQAMTASTIAEISIDRDGMQLEFEIGPSDVLAFANAYPDELYERLTGKSSPLAEREDEFFESDWRVRADGELLRGAFVSVKAAKRLARDLVSGDALSEQPSDAQNVVRLSLRYIFNAPPKVLTIEPPTRDGRQVASIGFICYHQGLHVNDFRYMPDLVTLRLDWSDPWFSSFKNRNLKRQFDSPLSVFLYVEPYEVRKEIIIRPIDLQQWVDLGLDDSGRIRVEQQELLKRRAAEFLISKGPVTIDGEVIEPKLDRIHFIRRNLRTTGIIEPPEDLDAISATLGVIYSYPVDQLPDRVSMNWDLFPPKIDAIPASASDEAGGLPSQLTTDAPVMEWVNYLKNPTGTALLDVAAPPAVPTVSIPLLSLLCLGGLIAIILVSIRQQSATGSASPRLLATGAIALVAAALALSIARVDVADPFSKTVALPASESNAIIATLLHNVYRSFDQHDEGKIYDRLSKSVDGNLLEQIYLETRRSMEIKNQGGLRVSVQKVNVDELVPLNDDPAAPEFSCQWRVAGSIGHWGHLHQRTNQHLANLTISPRDGVWKITNMELLDEQAVDKGVTSPSTADQSGLPDSPFIEGSSA